MGKTLRNASLTALFILFSINISAQVSKPIITSEAKERISKTLKSFVDSGRVAGASSLIFEKGNEVYFGAFGNANKDKGISLNRNSIVQIYSMTKPVTGVALMQLYEQNKFKLDDPVSKYAPEFTHMTVYEGDDEDGNPILAEPERALTIRDLTRHTSGFVNDRNHPYVGQLLADANPFSPEKTLDDIGKIYAELPLIFHPGEQWYYGPSVDVQAFLVERISGQPFAEYIQEHILNPLGMSETRYFVPENDRDRMSSAYTKNEAGELAQVPEQQAHYMNVNTISLTPGGWGLTSTLDDYQTFARMLVNEGTLNGTEILKPETVKLMATNHLADEVTERLWLPGKGQVGFGIDFAVRVAEPVDSNENQGVVGEFFWDGAASTLFWVDPVNELTAVFFVQIFPFDGTLHKDFREAVYGDLSKN